MYMLVYSLLFLTRTYSLFFLFLYFSCYFLHLSISSMFFFFIGLLFHLSDFAYVGLLFIYSVVIISVCLPQSKSSALLPSGSHCKRVMIVFTAMAYLFVHFVYNNVLLDYLLTRLF